MSTSREKSVKEISINQFSNKIYEDPLYRIPLPKAAVNYSIFSSKWDIEEVNEDNILKIIHRESGDSISLSFNTLKDKIEFVKNIYASQHVNQVGKGIDLEKLANSNIKPKTDSNLNTVIKKVINNFKSSESKN